MDYRKLAFSVVAAHALLAAPLAAHADALPKTMVWTTYDTGGAFSANAVAISSMLKQKAGINLRVLNAGNGLAQQSTLRAGRADYVLAGFDVYFAQEGLYQFGAKDWGPQAVRLVMSANDNGSYALAVRPDKHVKTPADLKGLRVANVKGSASIHQALNALIMGCGNMTWDDVKKVDVPGFGASVDAYINGDVDVYYTSTTSATSLKAAASNQGLAWVTIPHDDAGCWKRIAATDPRWVKKIATEGANIPKSGIEMASYPMMILNTTTKIGADYVHDLLTTLYDNFDSFKNAAPSAYGFALDRQILSYVVPYHEGAIRFFKEKGLWTAADQAHNDMLIKRQDVLKKAWDATVAKNISDDKAFAEAWQTARTDALKAAGL